MIQSTKLRPTPIGGINDFTLTVNVGNAQPSGTSVFFNGKLIHSGNDNFTVHLTSVKKGDEMHVVTTVSDLPQNPNRITVQHSLDNSTNTSASFDDAVSEGELAINTTRFDFY